MEQNLIDVVQVAGANNEAHDLSMYGLFMAADWVVKSVMVMLVLASIMCWAVIIEKILRMRKLRRLGDKFEDAFWSGGSLDDLFDRVGQYPNEPLSAIFSSAMREWRRSQAKGTGGLGLHARIERVMSVTLSRELEELERYLPFLASVGSSAPFIGLFGTVWGIMNSFTAIAASKQTSLAVVAPGMAEALFATALGLVAAIPASIAYNKISSDLNRYAGRMEGFAGEFSAIVSRQLDEG